MKWIATEMKIYKRMHFTKEVEHTVICPGCNCQLCMEENAENKSLKNLSLGLHFQGLSIGSLLSI